MSRIAFCFSICLVATLLSGCQSRCNNPCGTGWFAGNSRIAPPPTYSLNIPSVAQNPQPYYQPGNGTSTGSSGQTSQGSWRAPQTSTAPATNAAPAQTQTGQSRFVENNAVPGQSVLVGGQAPVRSASTTALPGTGSSFTDQRNFASTLNDERRDSTRVPVTDATSVRAPSQNLVGMQQTYAAQQNLIQPNNGYMIVPNQGYQNLVPTGPVLVANNQGLVPMGRTIASGFNPQGSTAVGTNSQGWRTPQLNSRR